MNKKVKCRIEGKVYRLGDFHRRFNPDLSIKDFLESIENGVKEGWLKRPTKAEIKATFTEITGKKFNDKKNKK